MNVRVVRVGRDRVALLAGLLAPLALTAILSPFRASLPNTDAALALAKEAVAATVEPAMAVRPGETPKNIWGAPAEAVSVATWVA